MMFENYWKAYYIYLIPYVDVFVNNYYDDKYSYSISSLEHNIETLFKKFTRTLQDGAVNMVREECANLSNYTDENDITKYDEDYGTLTAKVSHIWTCEPNACDICLAHEGEELEKDEIPATHPNCRCYVTRSIQWISDDGEIVFEDETIL